MNLSILILIVVLVVIPPPSTRGEISEPDNVLYGTIVIGAEQITAARSDVVIEARRTPSGAAIASYRMGTDPGLGNYYSLRIRLEALAPVTGVNASLTGDTLYIVLRDASGVQGQALYTIPERGHAQRVNFGAAVPDSDGNGLPDIWEIARFGAIGQNPSADADGDGQSNSNEWIAGTDPRNSSDVFHLVVSQTSGQVQVSFVALRASGAGYEDRNRFYSLESNTNLNVSSWTEIPGLTNILGNDQSVVYEPPSPSAPVFYRGKVGLQAAGGN